MNRRLPGPRGQGGFSLVEVLVTVAMVVPVILSATLGLFTAVETSAGTESRQVLETALSSYGESLRNLPSYPACGTAAQWNTAYDAWADRWVPESGAVGVRVSSIRYWDQATAAFVATCSTDGGAQRLTLTATRGGSQLTGTVVRRNPAARPGSAP